MVSSGETVVIGGAAAWVDIGGWCEGSSCLEISLTATCSQLPSCQAGSTEMFLSSLFVKYPRPPLGLSPWSHLAFLALGPGDELSFLFHFLLPWQELWKSNVAFYLVSPFLSLNIQLPCG